MKHNSHHQPINDSAATVGADCFFANAFRVFFKACFEKSATANVGLVSKVDEGKFSSELYYRLSVISISVLEQKESGAAIDLAIQLFLRIFSVKLSVSQNVCCFGQDSHCSKEAMPVATFDRIDLSSVTGQALGHAFVEKPGSSRRSVRLQSLLCVKTLNIGLPPGRCEE